MFKFSPLVSLIALVLCWISCKQISLPPLIKSAKNASNLSTIQLPSGFQIDYYAQDINNARSMCLGTAGTVFVGTRKAGKVYALWDNDNDYVADTLIQLAKGLNMPNGVAFKDGALYVAEVSTIWRYDSIETQLKKGIIPTPKLVINTLPKDAHHGWKYIAFGPDEKLYIPVGAPCNICKKSDERYASIMRMNADGSDLEVFAHGVRNSVGFDWHPVDNTLWFTDNGRDLMGDDIPPCELNHAPQKGMHFGYPHCHAGVIADPDFSENAPCNDFIAPAQSLGPHVAPLGMLFYTGNMFPKKYHHQILIAEHGSWNRSEKIGYRLMLVMLNKNKKAISYTNFADGWLRDTHVTGRPVDMLQLPDGSVLVSDDFADAIYRITYIE